MGQAMTVDWLAAAIWLGLCNLAILIVLGVHVWQKTRSSSPLAGERLPVRPWCAVHDSTPRQHDLMLRHSTNILCTCHPIRVASTPPTEPAMPPVRRLASREDGCN